MAFKQIKIKATNLEDAYAQAYTKLNGSGKLVQKHVILSKPTKKKLGLYLILADRGY